LEGLSFLQRRPHKTGTGKEMQEKLRVGSVDCFKRSWVGFEGPDLPLIANRGSQLCFPLTPAGGAAFLPPEHVGRG
jgi:hypothetical protein